MLKYSCTHPATLCELLDVHGYLSIVDSHTQDVSSSWQRQQAGTAVLPMNPQSTFIVEGGVCLSHQLSELGLLAQLQSSSHCIERHIQAAGVEPR